jgi:hypothetical protein
MHRTNSEMRGVSENDVSFLIKEWVGSDFWMVDVGVLGLRCDVPAIFITPQPNPTIIHNPESSCSMNPPIST